MALKIFTKLPTNRQFPPAVAARINNSQGDESFTCPVLPSLEDDEVQYGNVSEERSRSRLF